MTLIEQFSDVQEAYHDRSGDCVVVAENFAIGFAEWVTYYYWYSKDTKGFYKYGLNIKHTSKQLLEIYKKEKGL
jgi:hypothetical protein